MTKLWQSLKSFFKKLLRFILRKERGYVGDVTYYSAVILNDNWTAIIEKQENSKVGEQERMN